ncbi:MarR family winged helix-turn-helix transcriptional regulator [Dyella psychrodurans]|uniref:MarR family transcriptional regulator n=1 Tax=Dyella psychrodurans TaxID=1927960 RepID=A0A370X7M7_9GAMM|nr:MarR family winged helix-turn-helix transcriptional regulator [Dyella psychrodurans]RDS84270.1 MarR family transcriptional regulator [Dyella psychrodurans]
MDSSDQTNFPTPSLRAAYLQRFPVAAAQRMEMVFTLKSASQQITNVLNGWLESTAGSPARFQTLALLWGAGGRPVPHQEIIATLKVKRATVSAMMYSLEQEGFVQSVGDEQDRRRLLATLTKKGKDIFTSAMDLNASRIQKAFSGLAPEEIALFQSLFVRLRDGFLKVVDEEAKQ